jgi:hypothetical protein
VGFTLPSAGVTPAPGEKKSRNVEDAIPLPGSWGEAAVCNYLARYYFTGQAAGRIAAGR